ncbi:MAG TPA: hypothetical protein VLY21_02420 [Nitrososphaerales archaeon]|nr:hypothetical protein [Nitrososphaerales archaeon]
MAKVWEIRGLFGNEYAMENAAEELKKQSGLELAVLDRRNLSVRLAKRNGELEGVIRRTLEIHHGFVESEAPLGEYDRKREAIRQKKLRDFEVKKKAQAKGH